MSCGAYGSLALFGTGSAFAQSASTDPAPQAVVITGSRTALTGNDQPTPVTTVSTAELTANTPSNIPDALNKLPVFTGSSNATTSGLATSNPTGNYLNLRGFGAIRTLILEDGRRVPSTAANGTVDTNTLPQLLVKRVDVVTGGASAVYGSDAVTGVVNFVLDNRFQGVKVEANGGISSRSDDGSNKFGIAAGKSFADGRLHLEGSYEHYDSQGIDDKGARGPTADPVCVEGAGTAASPYRIYTSCRNSNQSFGGLIRTGPLAGQEFASNGVLTPFMHGTPTAASGIESGGDGTYGKHSQLAAYLRSHQLFGRADVDLSDDVKGYAQLSAARSYNGTISQYPSINPNVFSATNAFLTPAQQAALSGPGAPLVNGLPTFSFGKLFDNQQLSRIQAVTTNYSGTAGLKGRLTADLDWDAYYTHARSSQYSAVIGNNNNGLQYAALDAVVDPATGKIVCSVTLTNPGLYPGCTPINPFGPTAAAPGALDYFRKTTTNTVYNTMDDVGANIAGSVFETSAGPVRMAVSGEFRKTRMSNDSNADPTAPLDCTGLRFNCTSRSVQWGGNVSATLSEVSENISEGAIEATVPLLADRFLAKSLELNGAVRYAHYSVSGEATTFKVGFGWHVTDDLSFRGTRSRDIRAPTLFDLYQPLTQQTAAYADQHTGVSTTVPLRTQGNPDLKPEVAYTKSLGMIYQPHALRGFSLAVDYFDISMANAVVLVSGQLAATQAVCEASNGTSPLCALFVRPLPFSNRTAANYPTLVLAQPQNVAKTWTRGVDIEANYGLGLKDLNDALDGRLNLRLFVSYQPALKSMLFEGQPVINSAGVVGLPPGSTTAQAVPTKKVTLNASYSRGAWTVGSQVRWRSSLGLNGDPTVVFIGDRIPSYAVTDLNAAYRFKLRGTDMEAYVTVQNVFDNLAQSYASTAQAVNPGGTNTIVPGDDIIGRYFTAGLRMKF